MNNPISDDKRAPYRVRRGGSWNRGAGFTRVSSRYYFDRPVSEYGILGFRIVRNK